MVTALTFIVIIIISGIARLYFKHRFDVTSHIEAVTKAAKRQQIAKTRLHNVPK